MDPRYRPMIHIVGMPSTGPRCRTVLAAILAVLVAVCPAASVAAPLRLVTDTEVLRSVFVSMKQGITFEEFPWARAAQLVFRGERDAIFTAFHNEERARYCHFPSEPLARDKWIFFVRTADAARLRFSS